MVFPGALSILPRKPLTLSCTISPCTLECMIVRVAYNALQMQLRSQRSDSGRFAACNEEPGKT